MSTKEIAKHNGANLLVVKRSATDGSYRKLNGNIGALAKETSLKTVTSSWQDKMKESALNKA